MPSVMLGSAWPNCACATETGAPDSTNMLECVCRNACKPHRWIFKASRIGQSRCSTTLFDDGGRLFRVTKRYPPGFGCQPRTYSSKIRASGSGIGTVRTLFAVLGLCVLPYQADRRT